MMSKVATEESNQLRENANDEHDLPQISNQVELTQFVDEASLKENEQSLPSITKEVAPFPNQDIVDFLARPRVIGTFKWTASQAGHTLIQRFILPDALFASSVLWSKLSYFLFFRASIRFRVKVNGTAFHYGQLLFSWKPAALGRYENTTDKPTSYDSVVQSSQFQHMLITPMSDQNVSLLVPYELPFTRVPLSAFTTTSSNERTYSNFGVLDVYVLTPLRCTGKSTDPPVTVTLFGSFEDIDLVGNTHQPYTFVAASPATQPLAVTPWSLRFPLDPVHAANPTSVVDTAQSDEPFRAQSEPESQNPFGFFPVQMAPANPRTPTSILSLDRQDSFVSTGSPTLAQHLADWSFLTSVDIPDTQGINSLVFQTPVHPGQSSLGMIPDANPSTKVLLYTKLAYLSDLFTYWKGPIEYRLDFIASRFHSARFRATWYPPSTVQLAPLSDLSDALSKIIDVQGDTSESLEVPYLLPTPFLSQDMSINVRARYNGTLVVTLLNPISYPGPNAPPITMNVWIRAPGIKLAGLLGYQFKRVLFTGAPALTGDDPTPWFAQSESTLQPDTLDLLAQKPTPVACLRGASKFWITPPFLETMPKATVSDYLCRRANTLLDYLMAIHLGYRGSICMQLLNPSCNVMVVPRAGRGFDTSMELERKTTLEADLSNGKNSFNSANYFPHSVNAVKQFELPNYTTMEYRPFTMFETTIKDAQVVVPGVDIYQYSDNDTIITLFASNRFAFYGKIAAPFVIH